MTDWIVRKWARFGHERLYAETPGGTALGFLDLQTGRYHSDDMTNLPLLKKAIGDHLATTTTEFVIPPRLPAESVPKPAEASFTTSGGPRADDPPRGWDDISTTQAGAAARERALAERKAQGLVRHAAARIVGARTNERAWRMGASGEYAVAEQLAGLGPEWRVLHAVRVGERGSDIDHVTIGPAGRPSGSLL